MCPLDPLENNYFSFTGYICVWKKVVTECVKNKIGLLNNNTNNNKHLKARERELHVSAAANKALCVP